MTPPPHEVPTVVGMLTVGKDPCRFLPGAYVQFLRIDGTELSDPVKDQKKVTGRLLDSLRTIDTLINTNVAVQTDILSRPVEQRSPDYPVAAIQQLVRNAVLHRTYESTNAPVRFYWFSDRIEINSPGGPFGHVNRRNFGQPGVTDYRNMHLAEVMGTLGYVQRFGAGIPIAGRACARNGNLPPEFVVDETHVLAILRRKP